MSWRFSATLIACLGVLSLAATCVGHVEQTGDAGPWVGDVVNAGPASMANITVEARVYDASDRRFAPEFGNQVSAGVCPFTLEPGERGWFEIFFQKGAQEPEPVLPLRAEFPLVASGFDAPLLRDQGLTVKLMDRDESMRTVDIEVVNDSDRIYSEITVCGVLFDSQDHVQELGRADGPTLPKLLRPGESLPLEMRFNTLPPGEIRFFPIAYDRTPPPPCCMP